MNNMADGFYAQSVVFIHPPFRGCVPVDVTVGGQPVCQLNALEGVRAQRRQGVPDGSSAFHTGLGLRISLLMPALRKVLRKLIEGDAPLVQTHRNGYC
jgi:hypothetical protein